MDETVDFAKFCDFDKHTERWEREVLISKMEIGGQIVRMWVQNVARSCAIASVFKEVNQWEIQT